MKYFLPWPQKWANTLWKPWSRRLRPRIHRTRLASPGYVGSTRRASSGYVESFQQPLRATQRVSSDDFGISGFLFRKKSREIEQKVFLDSRDQHKILKFVRFLFMTSISYINPYFRAPSPLKPLKSSPRYQNVPGESLIAHSDHRGPVSGSIYLQKRPCCHLS